MASGITVFQGNTWLELTNSPVVSQGGLSSQVGLSGPYWFTPPVWVHRHSSACSYIFHRSLTNMVSRINFSSLTELQFDSEIVQLLRDY